MKPTSKPTDTTPRVIRGGSWISRGPSLVRAASRYSYVLAFRSNLLGFRTRLLGRMPR